IFASLLVGVAPGFGSFDCIHTASGNQIRRAFGAVRVLRDRGPATGDLAALADHARAIGIFVLHKVVVKNLAVALGVAHLSSTHALRANGMRTLDPVAHVKVMDVLLDDVVAGKPGEIIPIPDLVLHFSFLRQPFHTIPRPAIPVATQQSYVPYGAILQ